MRVRTVHVERRKSDGSYGNRMMAVTAELDDDDDAGAALDDLAALVRDRIDREERVDEARRAADQQARMARYRAEQEEVERSYRERVPTEAVTGEHLDAQDAEEEQVGSPEGDAQDRLAQHAADWEAQDREAFG